MIRRTLLATVVVLVTAPTALAQQGVFNSASIVPELDAGTARSAVTVLLIGLALLAPRRRRRLEPESEVR